MAKPWESSGTVLNVMTGKVHLIRTDHMPRGRDRTVCGTLFRGYGSWMQRDNWTIEGDNDLGWLTTRYRRCGNCERLGV